MEKKISSALISVFYKDGLEPLVKALHAQQVTIYTTGGTQQFIESLHIPCIAVESITNYPSILGGRVKTLHPKIFGGILGRRSIDQDVQEMQSYDIPPIDLVVVDLYPFEETVANTNDEALIIEKIDIGGPSMIRAAAKNFQDVAVIASKSDYHEVTQLLLTQQGKLTLQQRKKLAAKAFEVVKNYDIAIANYFNVEEVPLRYGENPHQTAKFEGNLSAIFNQLHGKPLSYNNLVDVDAAIQLMQEFTDEKAAVFAIIKHTNVCGIAIDTNLLQSWKKALAGDPESAFGGILICNQWVTHEVASSIHDIFFEVFIAKGFDEQALQILQQKKNRILLAVNEVKLPEQTEKTLLNGRIVQQIDKGNIKTWEEVGARQCSAAEKEDLHFANIISKHLKSNAIAITKHKQLIGKGCGQTSRIDALKQAINKAHQNGFTTNEAVMSSDAFFPFDDCVKIAFENQIMACIQPGGSIRDADSIAFCKNNNMAMVITEMRHFKH